MRLLLVEDDHKIASFVKKGFRAEGFAVDHASDGTTGLDWALSEPYDAAVVDIMLPGVDGLSLIGKMRRDKVMTPVIILSAKGSIEPGTSGSIAYVDAKHQDGVQDTTTDIESPSQNGEQSSQVSQGTLKGSSWCEETLPIPEGEKSLRHSTSQIIRNALRFPQLLILTVVIAVLMVIAVIVAIVMQSN